MEYKKDFKKWMSIKTIINTKEGNRKFFKEREIWWTSVGVNVGSEMDGKNNLFERPVLILRKVNWRQFIGVPMTSKKKTGAYYKRVGNSHLDSSINISQVKCFSSKRLIRKIKTVDKLRFGDLLNDVIHFIKSKNS